MKMQNNPTFEEYLREEMETDHMEELEYLRNKPVPNEPEEIE